MLRIADISMSFSPDRPVLRQISYAFAPGQVTGIIGPNGAGKSTLLRVLLGVLKPTGGIVEIDGRDASALPPRERAASIGYIPQHSEVAFDFSVEETVALGAFGRAPPRDKACVDSILTRVGLQDRKRDSFAVLSAGQQQRVTLARVLTQLAARDPAKSIILADEPVSAMDPRHALGALQLLTQEARRGVTVVVVLHDMHMAAGFTQQTILLGGDGLLAASGPTPLMLTPANLAAVFGAPFSLFAGPSGRQSALVDL